VPAAERCDECKFDADDYTRDDLLGTLRALAPMWRTMLAGVDESVLAAAPAPGVWSAREYVAHSRDVIGAMDFVARLALTEDAPVLGPPPDTPPPDPPSTTERAIRHLERNADRLGEAVATLAAEQWSRTVTIGDETVDVSWTVAHAVHDATHHLKDVGRGLHALGAGAPTQHGNLVQINTSAGGVPKRPTPRATIDRHGVVSDVQSDRKHHGRPLQALSLWSLEVIEALRAEGHPIEPGAAGENCTITGIDWTTIRPGVRIAIGEVLVEVSAFATPCAKNAQWFKDRNFNRMADDQHPGWSRAYAWVLRGGQIAAGNRVVVEP
jgi:MOSC domain-containing protein YiiM